MLVGPISVGAPEKKGVDNIGVAVGGREVEGGAPTRPDDRGGVISIFLI
jgi:hypothetical protein